MKPFDFIDHEVMRALTDGAGWSIRPTTHNIELDTYRVREPFKWKPDKSQGVIYRATHFGDTTGPQWLQPKFLPIEYTRLGIGITDGFSMPIRNTTHMERRLLNLFSPLAISKQQELLLFVTYWDKLYPDTPYHTNPDVFLFTWVVIKDQN